MPEVTKKCEISDAVLDELFKDYEHPEDLLGPDGLFKALKKRMIDRDHPGLSVMQQCNLVQLSRPTFYYRPVGVDAETLALMKAIDQAFTQYPFFGSRRIAVFLRGQGVAAGRHRIRRLMRMMGLEAIYKRPRTSQPHPAHPVYPYLLKTMTIDRPNQVWCAAASCISSPSWTGRRERS